MPTSPTPEEKVDREELRLKNRTAEAVFNIFSGEEGVDPYDFCEEVEAKGVTVTLSFPDGGGCETSGEHFVNGVWEAIRECLAPSST